MGAATVSVNASLGSIRSSSIMLNVTHCSKSPKLNVTAVGLGERKSRAGVAGSGPVR